MLGYYAIVTLHVLVCIILILVVLLQSGKGADLAGAFGGGATQTAFGSRGPASFLSKVTTGAAVLFMFTSIGLSGISTGPASKSIMETGKSGAVGQAAPAPTRSSGEKGKVLTPDEIKQQQAEIEARMKQQSQAKKAPEQPAAPAGTVTQPPEKKAPAGKNPY